MVFCKISCKFMYIYNILNLQFIFTIFSTRCYNKFHIMRERALTLDV